MRIPPNAGPTALATLPSIWLSARAEGSRSRPTSTGSTAALVGESTAEMAALRPLST